MAIGETSGGEVKKRALVRLALAGSVTLAALAGLWWLDQPDKPPPVVKPAVPKPIVSAPQPEPEPPAVVEEPAGEPVPEVPVQAAPPTSTSPSVPDTAVARQPVRLATAPPPPRVTNGSELPPPSPARPASPMAARPLIQADAPAAPPVAQPAQPQPGERDYVVRLGIFANPANAQDLVRRLNEKGVRAYAETRVQVGPFLNRQEAEKARAELARLGIKGVVVGATQ